MHSSLPRSKPRGMTTPNHRPRSHSPWTPPPPPPPASPAVRYVDIRVAVPADCPLDQVEHYVKQKASETAVTSPLTVASSWSPSPSSSSAFEMSPGFPSCTRRRKEDSPPAFGFIPIDAHATPQRATTTTTPLRSSSFSPLSYSLKSVRTETTAESSSLATALRAASPGLVASLVPPLYQTPVSRESESTTRPKTPSSLSSASNHNNNNNNHNNNGYKSPYTETDDSVKKTRLKTELCMHFANGRKCPFGVNCTYAHGEDELKMTKLLDMHKAGLVDADTYRTRPCWTWVATGGCPFGIRCTGIHDPRVAGMHPSWLTHTETQGNSIATDINVEALYQKKEHEIHCGTPFGEHFLPATDTWHALYQRIGNIVYTHPTISSSWIDSHQHKQKQLQQHRRRSSPALPPMVKLQIALQMRGSADFSYKYRPQHMVHSEHCMVLQKKAFKVIGNKNIPKVIEIAHSQWKPDNPKTVMVYELAFGPDSDPAARPVALWFNLDDTQVIESTAAQAKRFRWKRGLKNSTTTTDTRRSVFDQLDNFIMIRPHDTMAFDLATDILQNRLDMLRAERTVNLKERQENLAQARAEKEQLHERFKRLRKTWNDWGWPVNQGRETFDKTTPVPPVDGMYEPPQTSRTPCQAQKEREDRELDDTEKNTTGEQSYRIWQSFTQNNFIVAEKEPVQTTVDEESKVYHHLPIFGLLAQGQEISLDRRLPHIQRDSPYYNSTRNPDDQSASMNSCQAERCWKALLLTDEELGHFNEWELVQEHFDNSRSKKVLSIIQQK